MTVTYIAQGRCPLTESAKVSELQREVVVVVKKREIAVMAAPIALYSTKWEQQFTCSIVDSE